MSRKKRKKNKPAPAKPQVEKEQVEEPRQLQPAPSRSKRLILAIGALFLLVLIIGYNALFFNTLVSTGDKKAERQPFPAPTQNTSANAVKFEDFAGSEACAACHQEIYDLWKNSTHGKAGGLPQEVKLLGEFDGKTRKFKDGAVKPAINSDGQPYFEVEHSGLGEQAFTVDAIVGGGHMYGGGTQTYFSRFPDGTIRFLPFDYIRDEKLWFGETKNRGWIPIDENLSMTELSEWPPTRVLGAHSDFENCQECHGSQIQTTFEPAQRNYISKFQTLAINCESCHGPGREHIELAQSDDLNDREKIGVAALETFSKDASLDVCFQCHALKDVLEPGYLPGKNLFEHYALKFPVLGDNPYHADGRIKAFGYQQNHLFSDCYINGSMTCVDCHDPHSQGYRDIHGNALVGKFDNAQCTDCHASKAVDISQHTKHEPDSPGSECTACHMPFLQHKAMGDQLRFARSDHTIPLPRPAFDSALGLENACQGCHQDQSVDFLEQKSVEWWGERKPHKPIVAALAQAEQGKLDADSLFELLDPTDPFLIAQTAALSRYIEEKLRPDMPLEKTVVEKFKALSQSSDLDLKSLALAALHFAGDTDDDVHNFLAKQLVNLGENESAVRKRWSVALAWRGGVYRDAGRYTEAIQSYSKALEILPENIETLQNLGQTYRLSGQTDLAIASFEKAISLSPTASSALVNLGLAYLDKGESQRAVDAYRRAADVNPHNALAHFNLGNASYRENDLKSAIEHYQNAVRIDPALASGHYALARAFLSDQQFKNAHKSVTASLVFEPNHENAQAMLRDLNAYLNQRD